MIDPLSAEKFYRRDGQMLCKIYTIIKPYFGNFVYPQLMRICLKSQTKSFSPSIVAEQPSLCPISCTTFVQILCLSTTEYRESGLSGATILFMVNQTITTWTPTQCNVQYNTTQFMWKRLAKHWRFVSFFSISFQRHCFLFCIVVPRLGYSPVTQRSFWASSYFLTTSFCPIINVSDNTLNEEKSCNRCL